MIRIDSHVMGQVLIPMVESMKDGIFIEVGGSFSCTTECRIFVNDVQAEIAGNRFNATILIKEFETDIIALLRSEDECGEDRVRVVLDKCPYGRYRFAIDDNIFFAREIARDIPKSLFDCHYLEGLRSLNKRYGTKFVLNMFFATPEGDFSLDRFPAKYKSEFADNADWLSLAFHAYSEFPDRPYQISSAVKLAQDYDLVANEIIRFAGDAAYSPTTVIHWAMVPRENWPVLVERNTRILTGFFVPNLGSSYTADEEELNVAEVKGKGYDVNYCMDETRSEFLSRHDLLKDFDSGLFFSRCDIVCNNTPPGDVRRKLAPLMNNPATSGIMDILTHEQYFWPFYKSYRPDHFQRCEEAIRFCAENGFKPVFLHQEMDGLGFKIS